MTLAQVLDISFETVETKAFALRTLPSPAFRIEPRFPLHWSIDMAQAWGEPSQVVSLLLAAGASANSVDKNDFSALMMACGRNNEAILEQLIKAGANVQTRSAGTTPLHEAASNNFTSGIRRLLALGADPAETDGRNRAPEQLAEECGFAECVAVFHAARRADK